MKLYQHQVSPITDPRTPRLPLSSGQIIPEAIGGVGRALGTFAEAQARVERDIQKKQDEIAERLQKQQDDLELANLAGRYDAGLAEIKFTLRENPDYLKHPAIFTQEAQGLEQKLTEAAQNNTVRQALRLHAARKFPKEYVGVRTDSLQLFGEKQIASLDRIEEDLSKRAAESPTEIDRNETVLLYEDLVSRATQRGLLNPIQEQQKRRTFIEKVLEKNMDYLRRTDRTKLYEMDRGGAFASVDPIKRLKILEAARTDEEREDQRRKRIFEEAKAAVEWYWSAQANQGKLSDALIERALTGFEPFIHPEVAPRYKEINENPPTGTANLPIRIIMQEYHSGPAVQTRIDAARKQLKQLHLDTGQPSKLLDQAFNELQTDERTMRGVRAQEISAGIKLAEDDYKTRAPTVMPGKLGTMQRNQQAADLAEIRNKIRRGHDPAKAVEESLKRRKTEGENFPNRTKNILELAE